MKMRVRSNRRKPVYFTLEEAYERRMRGVEAAFRRTRAELAREWAQERLDEMDFPCLEFRSNSAGRFAVVRGTRLAVWHIALLARTLGWGQALAAHLEILPEAASSALGYYRRHKAEIDALIEANQENRFDQVKQKFPGLRRLDEVPA
jgi:uncharacterized protein (DUF433 family)